MKVFTKNSVIIWDKKREYESWNKDQTLLTAFKLLVFGVIKSLLQK